ncbi:MAG: AI-2E family transporter [Fimbriimonadaceae bacterium]|nr:AI-2E family transporter [Fimbriimonadaceae bacterium]
MSQWRIALWVAVVLAALGFLVAVRGILLPFALAGLIAMLLEPMVARMVGRNIPRPVAVSLITLGFFVVATGVLVATVPKVSNQLNDLRVSLQGITDRFAEETANDNHFLRWNPVVRAKPPGVMGYLDRGLERFRPLLEQFDLPTTRRGMFEQYLAPHRDDIAKSVQGFFNGFINMLGGAASQVFLLTFTPLFVFMLLADMENIRSRGRQWIPPSIRSSTVAMLDDIGAVFKNYVRGVLVNIIMFATAVTIVLSLVGTPYAFPLALLAGAFYLVPILGGWLAGITIFLVTGLSGTTHVWYGNYSSSWWLAAVTFVCLFVVTFSWDTFITPRVVGSAVDLHPLVSMFVVFSGGALFGLPGMMLAYPLAGAVRVTLARLMRVTNAPVDDLFKLPSVPLRHRGEPGV